MGRDGPIALRPSQLVEPEADLLVDPARASPRAAGSSSTTRSSGWGSSSTTASAWTSAPRPAASATACCSAAPPGSRLSTSPTGRSPLRARGSPRDRDRAAQRPRAAPRRPSFRRRLSPPSTSPSSRWPRCCPRSVPAWRRAPSCWRWSSPSSSSAVRGSARGSSATPAIGARRSSPSPKQPRARPRRPRLRLLRPARAEGQPRDLRLVRPRRRRPR